ncbi:hypothetical protein N9981_01575, partial [bacterium]|nr:hypothetical protein [bacterium]
ALACHGVLRLWIGEVIVVAEELADERSGGNATAADALGIDLPVLRLRADELDGAGAVVRDLFVVHLATQEGIVTAHDCEAGLAVGLDGSTAISLDVTFITSAKSSAVEEDEDGGVVLFSRPEVEHIALVLGIVFDISLWLFCGGGKEGQAAKGEEDSNHRPTMLSKLAINQGEIREGQGRRLL